MCFLLLQEWTRAVQQIVDRFEVLSKWQTGAKKRGTGISPPPVSESDQLGVSGLRSAARELASAGAATAQRLADTDVIVARIDQLQSALAKSELRVIGVFSQLHSPTQSHGQYPIRLAPSKSSIRSDKSDVDSNCVQTSHNELRVSCLVFVVLLSDGAGEGEQNNNDNANNNFIIFVCKGQHFQQNKRYDGLHVSMIKH